MMSSGGSDVELHTGDGLLEDFDVQHLQTIC